MDGIFISYRRDDSRHAAGRLGDDLAEAFGPDKIFRDVESIAPGTDFEVALDEALAHCAVMLVVIGPRWLSITDHEGRRRLDQPEDWIRIEVARALARQVRLIPVMLEDTPLPNAADLPDDLRGLVRRQTLPLSDGRWRGDLQRLVEALGRIPGLTPLPSHGAGPVGARPVAPAPLPASASPLPSPSSVLTAPPPPASSKKGLWTGVALGAGGLLVLASIASPSPPEPAPAPAPAVNPTQWVAAPPGPAPAAVGNAAVTLTPPDQLKAVADQALQGQWREQGDATIQIAIQQVGKQLRLQLSANGVAVGHGSGEFDGQRAVVQLQVQLLGQPVASGNCTLLWERQPAKLHGPCQWGPGVNEVIAWTRVGA